MNPIALRLHEAALTLDGGKMPEIVAMLEVAEREINRLEEERIDSRSGVSWRNIAIEMTTRCDNLSLKLDQLAGMEAEVIHLREVLKAWRSESIVKRLHRRFQAWRWMRRNPPCVVIDYAGQATDRPHVHVSAYGRGGSQGVYTFDLNDQGNACADLYGKGLAEIFNVPIVDKRDPKWPRTT